MTFLDTVSLGHYVFEIAAVLRESLFINGILHNTEVWYGLNKSQVQELEDVDKLLLRRILRAPISTPSEAFYLELGLLPIPYIIKGRRVMFLHYLLQLDNDEMLSEFFFAQWNSPSNNDWVLTVKDDLKELSITCNLTDIRSQSKETFKKLVKDSCMNIAFSNLTNLQKSHSKMSNVKYADFKMQSYFHDGSIDARSLFLYRTRMIRVRNNYQGSSPENQLCPLCKDEIDTQEHLLTCEKIHTTPPNVRYGDIFMDDLSKIKDTLAALKSSFKFREDVLNAKE